MVFFAFLCVFHITAHASHEDFDIVLDDMITENGVFDGENGIIYANIIYFSDYPSLLIVSVKDKKISCEVYDNTDGIQCTDILNIPTGYYTQFTLSSVSVNQYNLLMLQFGGNSVFYTVFDDCFTQVYDIQYTSKTNILSCTKEKCTSYLSKRSLYNFLNGLKRERIAQYSFLNCINTISDTEKQNILALVTACADIMDFDINDFDYNTLMKYILCTNQNFKILTSINSEYIADSGGISIVSAEYIDHILQSVFDLSAEHPAVNSLLSRGFCVDNGYYYYKNIFNTFYATDVIGIEGVYRLGGDIVYVVFTDIYRQGDNSFPEYSYAVIRKTDSGTYNLLKLGMGRRLLSERELLEIAPGHERASYVWNSTAKRQDESSIMLIILLLLCISFGAVALICGAALILREYRKQ